MIGIFWIYKDQIFGKAIVAKNGEQGLPGLFDSPDNHTDFWDSDTAHKRIFPELLHVEYDDIPRGRVLYNLNNNQAMVYMDRKLLTDKGKQLVISFFELEPTNISWDTDPHYVT